MSLQQQVIRPEYAIADSQSALLRSIFGWMTLGLAVTGLVSMYVLNTPAITQSIIGSPGLMFGLIIAELFLVGWLSFRVMKMSATKARGVFLLYSALNGITLSPLAFVYTGESIASTFMITAGLFGSMAFYGYVTKRDLSSMGSFMFMGLIGLIIASLVNIFMQSSMMSFVISVVGVIVFTGLTAWDVQKFKRMGSEVAEGSLDYSRMAIIGALSLYLDFINMFIFMLRLFGSRD